VEIELVIIMISRNDIIVILISKLLFFGFANYLYRVFIYCILNRTIRVVIEGEVCDKSPKGGKNLPGLSVISLYDASIATFPKKYEVMQG
jgi:hypothetical protein